MNAQLKVGFLILAVFTSHGSWAQAVNENGKDEERSRLVNGLVSNDKAVFEEVERLPIAEVAPLLLVYVNDASTNKERAEKARETLRKMSGFSEYMKGRLLEKRSKPAGEYEMQEFRMLAAIGGEEAAAAVAPFLFVNDRPLLLSSDHSAGPINYDALRTLVKMRLPDGPANKVYQGYTAPDIEEWKMWAEKKGYKDNTIVPLITLEEKGVPPAIIAQSEALLAAANTQNTALPQPSTSPTKTLSPLPSPKSTATPATPENKPASPGFPIWQAVILGATIVAGAVFLMRRRSR